MNPLTNVKNINKLNEREAELGISSKSSWHQQYSGSAYLFIGGLPYDLTEGDIICVFSQYGEIVNINLVRDKKSGKSKGFCFIAYEDQRSTILAVDNLNGIKLLGRTLRVDHVAEYRKPKEDENEDDITKQLRQEGCAPRTPSPSRTPPPSEDDESGTKHKDSAAKKAKKKSKKEKKKKKKKKKDKSPTSSSSSDTDSDNPPHSKRGIKKEKQPEIKTEHHPSSDNGKGYMKSEHHPSSSDNGRGHRYRDGVSPKRERDSESYRDSGRDQGNRGERDRGHNPRGDRDKYEMREKAGQRERRDDNDARDKSRDIERDRGRHMDQRDSRDYKMDRSRESDHRDRSRDYKMDRDRESGRDRDYRDRDHRDRGDRHRDRDRDRR